MAIEVSTVCPVASLMRAIGRKRFLTRVLLLCCSGIRLGAVLIVTIASQTRPPASYPARQWL